MNWFDFQSLSIKMEGANKHLQFWGTVCKYSNKNSNPVYPRGTRKVDQKKGKNKKGNTKTLVGELATSYIPLKLNFFGGKGWGTGLGEKASMAQRKSSFQTAASSCCLLWT